MTDIRQENFEKIRKIFEQSHERAPHKKPQFYISMEGTDGDVRGSYKLMSLQDFVGREFNLEIGEGKVPSVHFTDSLFDIIHSREIRKNDS
jgi:hypothetical protein